VETMNERFKSLLLTTELDMLTRVSFIWQ